MVADRINNREVAAQLFLSPRTIDFHLRNIYKKLQVRSRTELALHIAQSPGYIASKWALQDVVRFDGSGGGSPKPTSTNEILAAHDASVAQTRDALTQLGDEGLKKIVDLGEWWTARTGGLPLPLGGNVIRRDLGRSAIRTLSAALHDSIAYGLDHREEAVKYAMQFGRGLDEQRTDKFVGMYVNDLTLGYGERGRKGVERLLTEAFEKGLIPARVPVEFAA